MLSCLAAGCPAFASAGPIGPDNYDFARFSRVGTLWEAPGNHAGWTSAQADVNGDGKADLVLFAADASGWRTWVALANGTGSFAAPASWSAAGNGVGWTVELADVNGDGRADLLSRANDATSWRTSVAFGQTTGGFSAPVTWQRLGHYGGWTSRIGDVNGDGKVDLILQAADAGGWRSHVALSLGTGAFDTPVTWSAAGNYALWNIDLGDFNGDGRVDLSLDTHGAGWHSWVAFSTGTGSFAAPASWDVTGTFTGLTRARGDFNADGRTDLQLWSYDTTAGWQSWVALATGAGGFGTPVSWTSPAFGSGWTFGLGDVNGDGGTDLIAQRTNGKGWEARAAVALGDGAFITPKAWASLHNYALWNPIIADISGDGRADIVLQVADGTSWRAWTALAQGCHTVIGSDQSYVSLIAALTNQPSELRVCLKPGLYNQEILIRDKQRMSFIAAHGGVTIETNSFAFAPDASEGVNPGAPVQFYYSSFIDFDGITVRNTFEYQPIVDQRYQVSRAVEAFLSDNITIAHSHLIGHGKQVLTSSYMTNLTLADTQVDCYYFCAASDYSSLDVRSSRFKADHESSPGDMHTILWTYMSDYRLLNSTFDFVSGQSLFSGVNNFSTNVLELKGETVVTPTTQSWVMQHANYNGINLRVKDTYPALAHWYYEPWSGGGIQALSQICYYPTGGPTTCVTPPGGGGCTAPCP